jgi:glycosyltransferase involved in cell wall biosynthesis
MAVEPLVSVIMPTYKRLDSLPQALESVLAQTYGNFEILVSDNGPSEEVANLAASYGDERIRYRHNGGNIGPMRNALAAYRIARGAYLATLHDDDIWEPNFLQRLVPPLEADPDLTLAFSDHWIIRGDGAIDHVVTETETRRYGKDRLREGVYRPFYHLALVERAVNPVVAGVLRKSAIDWDYFPQDMAPAYDLWLAYLASRHGRGAYYCPDRLSRYRMHGSSLTAERRQDAERVFCYGTFIADERLRPIQRALRRASAPFHTDLGISLLAGGRRWEAGRHLLYGIIHGPEARGVVALALTLSPGDPASAVAFARRMRGH